MAKDPNILIGKNLEIARLRLLFSRDLVAEKSKITSRSIERIEKNDKYANAKDREKYIDFLGLSHEDLSVERFDITWQDLVKSLEEANDKSPKISHIPNHKLSASNVIKYRILPENLLLEPLNTKEVTEVIRAKFGYSFEINVVQNALNNLSSEGVICRIESSPIEYHRPIKNFPKDIDPLYEISQNLAVKLNEHEINLVKKTIRRNAKILILLTNGQQPRSEIFTTISMSNETNNTYKTIKVLEKIELIEKTEKLSRSRNQKYRLTDKGIQLLNESGLE